MKLFILFIILNLSSLTFVQAQEVLQTENLETSYPIEFVEAESLKTYPTEILDAEASIWKIYNDNGSGTGFFIDSKLFVTNFHVLEGLLKYERNLNNTILSQKGNPNTLNIKQVIVVSALYDLAIIEIKETSQHYLNLSETELLKTDDDLFAAGYPFGNLIRIKKIGEINHENDHFFSFPINHSNLLGASGSPVLNNQGQLVGVLFQGHGNLAYSIKINNLKNLIKGEIGQNCETMSIKNCLKN